MAYMQLPTELEERLKKMYPPGTPEYERARRAMLYRYMGGDIGGQQAVSSPYAAQAIPQQRDFEARRRTQQIRERAPAERRTRIEAGATPAPPPAPTGGAPPIAPPPPQTQGAGVPIVPRPAPVPTTTPPPVQQPVASYTPMPYVSSPMRYSYFPQNQYTGVLPYGNVTNPYAGYSPIIYGAGGEITGGEQTGGTTTPGTYPEDVVVPADLEQMLGQIVTPGSNEYNQVIEDIKKYIDTGDRSGTLLEQIMAISDPRYSFDFTKAVMGARNSVNLNRYLEENPPGTPGGPKTPPPANMPGQGGGFQLPPGGTAPPPAAVGSEFGQQWWQQTPGRYRQQWVDPKDWMAQRVWNEAAQYLDPWTQRSVAQWLYRENPEAYSKYKDISHMGGTVPYKLTGIPEVDALYGYAEPFEIGQVGPLTWDQTKQYLTPERIGNLASNLSYENIISALDQDTKDWLAGIGKMTVPSYGSFEETELEPETGHQASTSTKAALDWLQEALTTAERGAPGTTRAEQQLALEHLNTLYREAEQDPLTAGRFQTLFENLVNPVTWRQPLTGILGSTRAVIPRMDSYKREGLAYRNPSAL